MGFATAYLMIENTKLDEKAYDLNDGAIHNPSSIRGNRDANSWEYRTSELPNLGPIKKGYTRVALCSR